MGAEVPTAPILTMTLNETFTHFLKFFFFDLDMKLVFSQHQSHLNKKDSWPSSVIPFFKVRGEESQKSKVYNEKMIDLVTN